MKVNVLALVLAFLENTEAGEHPVLFAQRARQRRPGPHGLVHALKNVAVLTMSDRENLP